MVRRCPLRMESGRSLSIPLAHCRLVVEQVHLRGSANHVEIDGALGLGREVGQSGQATGGFTCGLAFDAQQRGKSSHSQAAGSAREELAAGLVQNGSGRTDASSFVEHLIKIHHLVRNHRHGGELGSRQAWVSLGLAHAQNLPCILGMGIVIVAGNRGRRALPHRVRGVPEDAPAGVPLQVHLPVEVALPGHEGHLRQCAGGFEKLRIIHGH